MSSEQVVRDLWESFLVLNLGYGDLLCSAQLQKETRALHVTYYIETHKLRRHIERLLLCAFASPTSLAIQYSFEYVT